MKKTLCIVVALLSLFACSIFVSCGDDPKTPITPFEQLADAVVKNGKQTTESGTTVYCVELEYSKKDADNNNYLKYYPDSKTFKLERENTKTPSCMTVVIDSNFSKGYAWTLKYNMYGEKIIGGTFKASFVTGLDYKPGFKEDASKRSDNVTVEIANALFEYAKPAGATVLIDLEMFVTKYTDLNMKDLGLHA